MAQMKPGFTLATTILLLLIAAPAARAVSDQAEKRMVERINKRYDDFFRHRHQEEEMDQERRAGVPELEKKRAARKKMLIKAREEYVKTHVGRKRDPKLEAKWEAEQKARHEEHLIEGKRYLQREIDVEKIQARGRQIPPNLEYDIED